MPLCTTLYGRSPELCLIHAGTQLDSSRSTPHHCACLQAKERWGDEEAYQAYRRSTFLLFPLPK